MQVPRDRHGAIRLCSGGAGAGHSDPDSTDLQPWVKPSLIVPGDPTTTAANIVASEGLFRAGIVSDLVLFLIEVALVVLLYVLLRPVNKTLALVSALFRLAMTIVQGIGVVSDFTALQLLGGADYLTAFDADQLHSLALVALEARAHPEVSFPLWLAFRGVKPSTPVPAGT